MLAICITWQRQRSYNFSSLQDSRLRDHQCHWWVHYIVATKIWYECLCIFVWFLIIFFDSSYLSTMHKHTALNNNTILFAIIIVMAEITMLMQKKFGFRVCVISFNFYSAHYKVYIHIPCINTQRQTTASFDITTVISSSNRKTPRLYKGTASCCEVDHNSDKIRLLQPYQTINYCNQSILVIVPYLNIFSWSITIIDLTWWITLVHFVSIMWLLFV